METLGVYQAPLPGTTFAPVQLMQDRVAWERGMPATDSLEWWEFDLTTGEVQHVATFYPESLGLKEIHRVSRDAEYCYTTPRIPGLHVPRNAQTLLAEITWRDGFAWRGLNWFPLNPDALTFTSFAWDSTTQTLCLRRSGEGGRSVILHATGDGYLMPGG